MVVNNPVKSIQDHLLASRLAGASDRELAALYASVPMVYGAANIRARNVANISMQVLDKRGESIDDRSHPLKRMFTKNAKYDALMKRTELSLCFYGHSLWYKRRNVYGDCVAVQWINPLAYQYRVDSNNELSGFAIMRGAQDTADIPSEISIDDAVYFNLFDFNDDHDGIGPAEVAFLQASAGYEGAQAAYSVFKNLAIPFAHAQPKDTGADRGGMWQEAANKLAQLLQTTIRGARNAGKTIITGDRWEWQVLQFPFKDLDMTNIITSAREDVAIAFEMPVELLLPSASNYAQYEGAKRTWGDGWLKPQLGWYASVITDQLADEYRDGSSLEPDYSDVDFLKEDQTVKIANVTAKYNAGAISLYDMQVELDVEPVDTFKNIYNVPGIGPIPISEIATIWRYQVVASSADIGTDTVGLETDSTPPDDTPTPDNSPLAPDPDKGLESLWIGLKVGDQPDLVELQRRVKDRVTGDVKWTEPDDLHVTLLYAPAVTALDAYRLARTLYEIDPPELELSIGSLKTFDTLGEYAIHFRIRRNTDLLDLQETVYDSASELGLGVSAYSRPDSYVPHITLGYATERPASVTFTGNVKIQPAALVLGYGDKTLFERSFRADEKHWKELKNWQLVLDRKGRDYAFEVSALPVTVESYVKARLTAGDTLPAIFATAKAMLLIKSIQSTRLDFENEFEDLLSAGRNNRITRARFGTALRAMITKYGNRAYRDGLIDGGVEDASTDEDDIAAIRSLIADQSANVTSFADTVYGAGLSSDEAALKPAMWFNGSIHPFYSAGVGSADRNGMYEFVLGKTEEHCIDCLRLNGQIHRFKSWQAKNLIPGTVGQATECKGYHCDCKLLKTSARAKGAF